MASVAPRTTKAGERRWAARYRDPMGRSRERWFTTKEEARGYGIMQESKLRSGRWTDPALGNTPLAAWAADWERTLVALKPKTRDTYESLLRSRILPSLGHLPLATIRPSMIKTWMAEMEDEGLSASRINQSVNLLSRILRDAVGDELIQRNPCDGIRRPTPRRAEVVPLTPSELEELIAAVDTRYATLVAALAYMGLRFGEACALRRQRVNPLHGKIEICESMSVTSEGFTFGPTKTHQQRHLIIPKVLHSYLENHLASVPSTNADDLVFTAPAGGPIRHSNFTRRVWKPAVRAIGYEKLRIHDLRHTCASLLLDAGASLVDIAAHLGHENATTTLKYYGHLVPGSGEQIAAKLDEILGSTA